MLLCVFQWFLDPAVHHSPASSSPAWIWKSLSEVPDSWSFCPYPSTKSWHLPHTTSRTMWLVHMPHLWRSWVIHLSFAQGFSLGHLWWTLQWSVTWNGALLFPLAAFLLQNGPGPLVLGRCRPPVGTRRVDSKFIRDPLAFSSSLSSTLSVSSSSS